MFGLAQLYQLRGRVGALENPRLCAFTVPANRTMTPQAERRLKVLQSLDSLGAGPLASMISIFAAQAIFWDEQSGHIKEVG